MVGPCCYSCKIGMSWMFVDLVVFQHPDLSTQTVITKWILFYFAGGLYCLGAELSGSLRVEAKPMCQNATMKVFLSTFVNCAKL